MEGKISRRGFLFLSALAAFDPISVLAANDYSFLYAPLIENIPIDEVEKGILVGPDIITKGRRLTENQLKKHLAEYKKRGWNPSDVSVLCFDQIRAFPADKQFESSTKKYTKKAMETLEEFIDYDRPKFGNLGDDDYMNKIFFAKGFFIYNGSIDTNTKTNERVVFQNVPCPAINGGIALDEVNTIVLSCNMTALFSPFAELIPIITYKADQEYKKKVGCLESNIVKEAFSEAMARYLMLYMIDKYEIPVNNKILHEINEQDQLNIRAVDVYRDRPKAMDWFKQKYIKEKLSLHSVDAIKNVIKSSFEFYMKDPGKFREAYEN